MPLIQLYCNFKRYFNISKLLIKKRDGCEFQRTDTCPLHLSHECSGMVTRVHDKVLKQCFVFDFQMSYLICMGGRRVRLAIPEKLNVEVFYSVSYCVFSKQRNDTCKEAQRSLTVHLVNEVSYLTGSFIKLAGAPFGDVACNLWH